MNKTKVAERIRQVLTDNLYKNEAMTIAEWIESCMPEKKEETSYANVWHNRFLSDLEKRLEGE